jgi:aryl-alcohol dehydrogenase-like predicted oxidoreductase
VRRRSLGKSLPSVSVVAHGLWPIGGRHLGPADDRDSIDAIHAAADIGINLFDTAPVYGFGHSEEVLGRALTDLDESVVVATKCGLSWDDRGRVRHDSSPSRVLFEVEQSLKRLNRETIDLYQLHWPDPSVPIQDTLGALMKLKEQGKIRAIGLCNIDEAQLSDATALTTIDAVQMPYNILSRTIENGLLAACRSRNIGILAYEPLGRGLLTGRYGPDHRFPKRDLRSRDARFLGDRFLTALSVVEGLRDLGRGWRLSVAQIAVAFATELDGIVSALCGARRANDIRETAQTGAIELPVALRDAVMELLNEA